MARPDELAAEADIERSRESDRLIKRGANLAVGVGSAALGAGAASRILPFLSEFIPVDMALKGISKVSPKVGEFLKKGQSMGLDIKEGLDFIKQNLTPASTQPEEPQENPIIKEAKNFETNYPDIVKAIMRTIEKGHSPQSGAELLKKSDIFKTRIKKIEKETGKNFVDFIVDLMGNQPMQQQAQPQEQVQPTQQTQPQPQAQPQAQPQGGVDPQLLSLIQGIRGSLQGMRNG